MKAIIVTHPQQSFISCLYGLEYEKLCLLAEFRALNKESIQKRFKTVEYDTEEQLSKKIRNKVNGMYKITPEQYNFEIKNYFQI